MRAKILIALALLLAVGFGVGVAHFADPDATPGSAVASRLPADEVKVATVEELIKAVRSHRTILLAEGDYVFNDSNLIGGNPNAVSYAGLSPHYEAAVFRDLEDVALVGLGKGARILQPDGYNWVLSFMDVKKLTLKNLVLGHHIDKGYCQGGVLRIVGGHDILVSEVDLFGSGTEGLSLAGVHGMTVEKSVIRDCTESLMSIAASTGIKFVGTSIRDNNASLRGIAVDHSQLEFVDSDIVGNVTDDVAIEGYGELFDLDPGEYLVDFIKSGLSPKSPAAPAAKTVIRYTRGTVAGNNFKEVTYDPAVVSFTDTKFTRP